MTSMQPRLGKKGINRQGHAGVPNRLTNNYAFEASPWFASRAAIGATTVVGPQGYERGRELICDGGADPQMLQTVDLHRAVAGTTVKLQVWAKSAKSNGLVPGFKFITYGTYNYTEEVGLIEQAITPDW